MRRERRFASARRTDNQRRGSANETAAEQRVELATRSLRFLLRVRPVIGGNETRKKNAQAAGFDIKIVITAAKPRAAQLGNSKAAALGTVFDRQMFELQNTVNDRMDL
jgi:hypothetical protein